MTIEDIVEYRKNAIKRLENDGQYATATAVDMAFSALIVLDQIRWERDIAIEQLEELGLSLGQKFGCEHCRYKRMSCRNLWCDIFDKIMPEDGYCCYFEFGT